MVGRKPVELAYNDPEACANAAYRWFQEYAGEEVITDIKTEKALYPFELYPIPSTNGSFTISFPSSSSERYQLTIFSLDGKKVYEHDNLISGRNQVNSELGKGIYILYTNIGIYTGAMKLVVL